MPRFFRTLAPQFADYRRYKPYLRRDFRLQCAYCERTEAYFRTDSLFGADHFKPAKLFPALVSEYSNLYYCCNECNSIKGYSWPSEVQSANGFAFPDPCTEDPHLVHYEERSDRHLHARTRKGEFALARIKLNRETCLRFRSRRAQRLRELRELSAVLESPEIDAIPPNVQYLVNSILTRLDAEWREVFGGA